MKHLISIALTVSLVLISTTAFADRGNARGDRDGYYSRGERIERHLDRKGDRIQHRFEHKADRADARGKYFKADRMRYKGERINRHLDRKGQRLHARHDRHKGHKHYRKHKHYYKGHRYYYPRPHVVYRDHAPYDSYFGVVINQPGLWLGWRWYD